MNLSLIKKTVLFMGLFFCFISSFQALPALAQTQVDKSYGLDETMGADNSKLRQALSDTDPRERVGQIIGIILSFIGVVFLVLMIYAGILWMTAAGNDQQVNKAKNLLINAIIGLIIVFAAYAITAYVGDLLTNTSGT
ncbi:MAG: pilin [Patescibacteria group bacterium]